MVRDKDDNRNQNSIEYSLPQDRVEDCDSSGVTLIKVHGPSAARGVISI